MGGNYVFLDCTEKLQKVITNHMRPRSTNINCQMFNDTYIPLFYKSVQRASKWTELFKNNYGTHIKETVEKHILQH